MNSFHDVRFPEDISYGSRGGPVYSTGIVTALSGQEQRNINWQEARVQYNVAYGVRSEKQLTALLTFFRARKGRAHAFRFKDWNDYKLEEQIIGQGDGVTTVFSLVKTYNSGDYFHERQIFMPMEDTLQVYLQGTELLAGWSFNNGAIVFDVAPAVDVAISVSAEFDVPMRFDTDALAISLDTYGIGSAENVLLTEVRL